MHTLMSISGAHKTASQDGQTPVDFIFERDLDSSKLPYKTLLLPNPYLLSTKQYQNLKHWVKAGGTLITEARFGQKDENAHLYPKPLLEDLLGVVFEYTEPGPAGFIVKLAGQPKQPRLINQKLGQGKVVYANFSLFLKIENGDKKLKQQVARLINR